MGRVGGKGQVLWGEGEGRKWDLPHFLPFLTSQKKIGESYLGLSHDLTFVVVFPSFRRRGAAVNEPQIIFYSTVIKIRRESVPNSKMMRPQPLRKDKCSKEQENTLIIQLTASVISLVVISLVIVFFQKNLFSAKRGCDVHWWGFGLFLYILSIIYLLATIASLTWSSIDMSNYNKACKDHHH